MSFIGNLAKEMAGKKLSLVLENGKLRLYGPADQRKLWLGAVRMYKDKFIEYLQDPEKFDDLYTHPRLKGKPSLANIFTPKQKAKKKAVKLEKVGSEDIHDLAGAGDTPGVDCMTWDEKTKTFGFTNGSDNRDSQPGNTEG